MVYTPLKRRGLVWSMSRRDHVPTPMSWTSIRPRTHPHVLDLHQTSDPGPSVPGSSPLLTSFPTNTLTAVGVTAARYPDVGLTWDLTGTFILV